ncbi:MAG: hypothetical protein ACRDD7_08225, partial [Peptostreptococcaceae bacterium]
ILKKLTSTIEDKENMLNGPKRNLLLISCIFNLVSHYRNYFNKKRVCSRVYIYGPEDVDSIYLNRNYIEGYRTNSPLLNRDKLTSIGNTYSGSIKLLKTILSYVEGVYFITTGIIEPSVLPLIVHLNTELQRNKNFIVTDDKYEYQYIKENFIILKPRMEKSVLINQDNVMDILKEKTKCNNIKNPNVNFIPFILSILGDKYRDIPKINRLGISSIYKELNKGLNQNVINGSVTNILSLNKVIDEKFHNQITLNYLCTNIFEQEKRLSKVDRLYIKNQIVDKYDAGYLRELNDNYFLEFPLNVIEINRGIKTKNKVSWR